MPYNEVENSPERKFYNFSKNIVMILVTHSHTLDFMSIDNRNTKAKLGNNVFKRRRRAKRISSFETNAFFVKSYHKTWNKVTFLPGFDPWQYSLTNHLSHLKTRKRTSTSCQIEIHFSIKTTKFPFKYTLLCSQINGRLIILFNKHNYKFSSSFFRVISTFIWVHQRGNPSLCGSSG